MRSICSPLWGLHKLCYPKGMGKGAAGKFRSEPCCLANISLLFHHLPQFETSSRYPRIFCCCQQPSILFPLAAASDIRYHIYCMLSRAWLSIATLTAVSAFLLAAFLPHLSAIVAPFRLVRKLPSFTCPMATQPPSPRVPVYFVSHGGPNTMFEKDHPVYPQLQGIGKEITTKVKPKAIVVFSAHWQAERPNTIEVNVSEQEPLLYDFYGFPKSYYMEKFPNRGSKEISQRVIDVLGEAGIKTQAEERGLDHGVFVPFKIMFNPENNPIDVPIVQVSMFDDDNDAEAHIKLGRAVEKLRDENICIIVSGMSVHNLRHLQMMGMGARDKTMPYVVTFDAALKDAVETTPGAQRDQNMIALLETAGARHAHPTFEHLVPIHIGVGAAGQDRGKQLWTMTEMSFGWAQYRFGEVSA
jgi:4,5-DOPA dioxygenase extradiol